MYNTHLYKSVPFVRMANTVMGHRSVFRSAILKQDHSHKHCEINDRPNGNTEPHTVVFEYLYTRDGYRARAPVYAIFETLLSLAHITYKKKRGRAHDWTKKLSKKEIPFRFFPLFFLFFTIVIKTIDGSIRPDPIYVYCSWLLSFVFGSNFRFKF